MGAPQRRQTVQVIDGLHAATAMVNGLTLVTRNERNVAGLAVAVLKPFRQGNGQPR
jgi:predicted nucleic acid-binding protein